MNKESRVYEAVMSNYKYIGLVHEGLQQNIGKVIDKGRHTSDKSLNSRP